MKGHYLFIPVVATLLMAGCSQDEVDPVNGGGNGDATTSYMAVNLMSSDVAGSRAASGYEDGSDIENKVEKVRFYFFTANGAVANVKLQGGSYVNYYDWTPGTGDQTDDKDTDDTESILAATIVISTKEGDKLPQSVAAVLNPTADLGSESKSLTALKELVKDYAADEMTKIGKFVMFNSVYGKDKAEVCAVPIESVNLQKEADKAKENPVTIYVERSVAKVKVSLASLAGYEDGKLALKDKKGGNDLKVNGQQVYLKLDNWSLTAETDEGRLVKAIDPTWTSDWWNGTGQFAHRSFWAINSSTADNDYFKYSDIKAGFQDALYTNENALDFDAGHPIKRTKVIIKGTLCKEDGTPFTIVRHLGAHFADTYSDNNSENLPELKKNILSQLSANGYLYYFGNDTERTQIGTDDIQIVIAKQLTNEDSKNNCYVYAQLTEAAKGKTWYASSDKAVTETVSPDDINTKLADKKTVDWALVWNSGMTYYYYEIIHNGTGETATKGVVRNHIYATSVTSIAGLGTPVYDPTQVIYPEKPDPNDHFIAAVVNILSWRVVNNSYDLEW